MYSLVFYTDTQVPDDNAKRSNLVVSWYHDDGDYHYDDNGKMMAIMWWRFLWAETVVFVYCDDDDAFRDNDSYNYDDNDEGRNMIEVDLNWSLRIAGH